MITALIIVVTATIALNVLVTAVLTKRIAILENKISSMERKNQECTDMLKQTVRKGIDDVNATLDHIEHSMGCDVKTYQQQLPLPTPNPFGTGLRIYRGEDQ
jgi:hypothetical protein